MIKDPVQSFNDQWMVYDYWQHPDNPDIRLEAKYDVGNVRIQDKMLQLQQLGFEDSNDRKSHYVSMAGLQTRRQDIMHGTFRANFKVEGANGGSCAAWFWHRNDVLELDIEAVTKGDSKVNNTINYTTHPSLKADGTPIPNATLSVPLSTKYNTKLDEFHEHRFDSTRARGSRYYIDGHLMHKDSRLVQKLGGNLQLKLWADGNKWWSGTPSSTTVTMSVKSIIAYFNSTGIADGTNQDWFETCDNAGGPSKDTVCEAYAEVGKDDDLPLAASGEPTASTTMAAAGAQSPDCWLGICIPTPTSQAVRNQPVFLTRLRGFVSNSLSKLNTRPSVTPMQFFRSMIANPFARDEPTYTLPFGSPVEDEDDEEHTNTTTSQGARVRPPPWLRTLYARNNTPVTYRTKHIPVVKDLTSDLRTERQIVEGCGRDRNDPCSFGQILDLAKWWSCLRERSDWCFFFSGSSFLLTNGLIQIISVPVIFAWVFYMTEG